MHYSDDYWQETKESEGGNRGVIASYDYKGIIGSLGVIKNSYLRTSVMATLGYNIKFKNIDNIFSVGLANGYQEGDHKMNLSNWFNRNGTIPFVVYSCKVRVYKSIGFQLNISPVYINYGVAISLDSNKKNRYELNRKF